MLFADDGVMRDESSEKVEKSGTLESSNGGQGDESE